MKAKLPVREHLFADAGTTNHNGIRDCLHCNLGEGPVTRLYPADDVAELAEALREFATRDCRCTDGFDQCQNVDHVAARALLARFPEVDRG